MWILLLEAAVALSLLILISLVDSSRPRKKDDENDENDEEPKSRFSDSLLFVAPDAPRLEWS